MTEMRFRRRALMDTLAAIGSPTALRAEEPLLSVGHIQADTEPSAAPGGRARDKARLAADEFNAAGGMKDAGGKAWRVPIEASDMGNDARHAVTLFGNTHRGLK